MPLQDRIVLRNEEAVSIKHLSVFGHVLSFMFLESLVQGMCWIFDQTVTKAGLGKHKPQCANGGEGVFYALGYIKRGEGFKTRQERV